MLKWIILFASFFGFLFLMYNCYKYRNPYKLYMIMGKKGSGKTTLLLKLAVKYIRKGRLVYSTTFVPGALQFDPKDIGKIHFEPNSVIFIDEVGMIFDNRDFKNFRNDTRDWFKLQRHYGCTVYLFSQSFDIDVKLRKLTDQMYLVRSFFNCISIARRIDNAITMIHPDGNSEARITDDLDFSPWFTWPFGGILVTWIPSWVNYFDSFEAPQLKIVDFKKYDVRSDLYESLYSSRLSALKRSVRELPFVTKAVQFLKDRAA